VIKDAAGGSATPPTHHSKELAFSFMPARLTNSAGAIISDRSV
jgi:hypothetical protein